MCVYIYIVGKRLDIHMFICAKMTLAHRDIFPLFSLGRALAFPEETMGVPASHKVSLKNQRTAAWNEYSPGLPLLFGRS